MLNVKKIAVVANIAAAAVLSVLMIAGAVRLYEKKGEYQKIIDNHIFADNTVFQINEAMIDASGMKPEEVYDRYTSEADKNTEITVKLNGDAFNVNIAKYCSRTLNKEDLDAYINDLSFLDYILQRKRIYKLKDKMEYKGGAEKEVYDIIKSGQYTYTSPKDAYFDKENLEPVAEQYGTQIDAEKAMQSVKQTVSDGKREISIGDESVYLQPAVKEGEIKQKFEKVMKLSEWTADYSVSDYVIKMSDHKDSVHVHDDGTYSIDTSFLTQAVLELSKTVDQTYKEMPFKSTKDGNITVKGGTYGQIMDNAKEIQFLKEKLECMESVSDRQPVWKCPPVQDGKNPDEYVEVDISRQHVWHYKNGKLCCETDCVTGTQSLKRDTPTGAYFVSEMVNGKYLTGTGYRTWVNKWMRLTNSGIGLHDAGWRRSFGGSIYKTSGSHGCINLPPSYASKLYSEIKTGTLVVIHD